MISKWLFSGAFLFELSSWASVFADLPFGQALALYLFAHGLGSALLCVGVWLLLRGATSSRCRGARCSSSAWPSSCR